jgi:hypothetical protein
MTTVASPDEAPASAPVVRGPFQRRMTGAFADAYSARSMSGRMRARRWEVFRERFPDVGDMRVLDLGGDVRNWTDAGVQPGRLVLLNLYPQAAPDGMEALVGDACDPPEEVREQEFDLVYSNSVIEHVGGHAQRAAFAAAVRSLAPHHWVQTPYRYFPVEPHWLFPGLQFLPFRAQVQVTQHWPLGHRYTTDPVRAVERVSTVELLGRSQLRSYFPDSDVWEERFSGMTKSLVAIL